MPIFLLPHWQNSWLKSEGSCRSSGEGRGTLSPLFYLHSRLSSYLTEPATIVISCVIAATTRTVVGQIQIFPIISPALSGAASIAMRRADSGAVAPTTAVQRTVQVLRNDCIKHALRRGIVFGKAYGSLPAALPHQRCAGSESGALRLLLRGDKLRVAQGREETVHLALAERLQHILHDGMRITDAWSRQCRDSPPPPLPDALRNAPARLADGDDLRRRRISAAARERTGWRLYACQSAVARDDDVPGCS